MRTVMFMFVVVGLLAGPSLGVVNVKLVADGPVVDGKVQLAVGGTTVMHIMARGTASGIFSLAGDVVANPADPILLASSGGSLIWSPLYNPTGLFTPKLGMAGPNGGWINWGTQQTNWITPDGTLGLNDYIEVFSYLVTATAPGPGDVHLSVSLHSVGGYKPLETDKTGVLGTLTPVTIHIVPEPMTLALLALGGMVVVRRRRV